MDDTSLDGTCVARLSADSADVEDTNNSAPRAVVETNNLWTNGSTLDIHFMNGTDAQKSEFQTLVSEWMDYANLLMRFGQSADDAEIRVEFGNKGNWSYVGKVSATIKKGRPTMAIQNMSSAPHEMGHAIGMVHEHQSPGATIQWNKPVVYKALGGPPNNWDKAKVDHNVINKYSSDQTQFTKFDPKSVMLYFFPARWTLNGVGTQANKTISTVDASFLARCYPGCTIDFSKREIKTAGTPRDKVKTGPGTMYNQYYGHSWLMHSPGSSFIEIEVDQPQTYDGDQIYTKAVLKMVHLTSMSGGKAGNSPVTITLNGHTVKANYSPPSGNYMEDSWDVTDKMADGANVLRIEFDKGASTNYWLQTVKLDCVRAFG